MSTATPAEAPRTDTEARRPSSWMTVQQVAEELCVSLSTAYRFVGAAAAEREGKAADDVSDDVRAFMGKGFPPPVRLGPRITRISRDAFERWQAEQMGHTLPSAR